jgi:hypothetical protein
MMPCDALSGFEDAPTMALVVASVRIFYNCSSDGVW